MCCIHYIYTVRKYQHDKKLMASWLQNASSLAHICIAHHTYISTHACTDKWTTPKQCLQPHLYDEWRHENKRQPYRWIKWVTHFAMYEKQRLTSSWYHFLQNFSTGSTRLSDWTFMLHQGTVTTGRDMSLAETVSPRRRHSTKYFKAPPNCIWTQQLKIYTINVFSHQFILVLFTNINNSSFATLSSHIGHFYCSKDQIHSFLTCR